METLINKETAHRCEGAFWLSEQYFTEVKPLFFGRFDVETLILFNSVEFAPTLLDFINKKHTYIKFVSELEKKNVAKVRKNELLIEAWCSEKKKHSLMLV